MNFDFSLRLQFDEVGEYMLRFFMKLFEVMYFYNVIFSLNEFVLNECDENENVN